MYAYTPCPLIGCGNPTTAASATDSADTNALPYSAAHGDYRTSAYSHGYPSAHPDTDSHANHIATTNGYWCTHTHSYTANDHHAGPDADADVFTYAGTTDLNTNSAENICGY